MNAVSFDIRDMLTGAIKLGAATEITTTVTVGELGTVKGFVNMDGGEAGNLTEASIMGYPIVGFYVRPSTASLFFFATNMFSAFEVGEIVVEVTINEIKYQLTKISDSGSTAQVSEDPFPVIGGDVLTYVKAVTKTSDIEFPYDLVFGQTLFIGLEPAQPDEVVTIFDTPAPSPGLTIEPGDAYEYGSVQIRVRARNYADGWLMANLIKQTFLSLYRVEADGCLYTVIYAASVPAFLEWDDNSRCKFVMSIETQRIERE